MIYLDSSVALAQLLAEDRTPPETLWQEPLVASRLLEYEVWNRLNARGLGRSHGEEARALVGRVALLELLPPVLGRALEPFPAWRCARSTRCIWHRSSSCAVAARRSSWRATTGACWTRRAHWAFRC
jgi:hypothetical protein